MLSFEQALDRVLENARVLGIEDAAVSGAVGFVLAEDVVSSIAMPPFNKSAMDGYAVRVSDISGAPVKLDSVGCIEAGSCFDKQAGPEQCVKIMTGAPVPDWADTVVMIEDTESSQRTVTVKKAVQAGSNICVKGEDISVGEIVVKKNTLVTTAQIAALAAVGRVYVSVYKKPQVSIVNTGGEIVPAGRDLPKNKIYNSNGPMLEACLKKDGFDVCCKAHACDKEEELKEVFSKALEADVMLISGGVSMGDFDLVPGVLEQLGVEKVFYKVEVKPGKPLFFGRKGNTLVFGIPGNPVSNFMAYHLFVRSALYKAMGRADHQPEFFEAVLEGDYFQKKADRRNFVPAHVYDKLKITSVGSHGSADIIRLAEANSFMVVDKGVKEISSGTKVRCFSWL